MRRHSLVIGLFGCSSLLASCGEDSVAGLPASATARAQRVLLISCDTLRADRLGAYGYDRDVSPHLDAFAREGVVFQEAYASASVTRPSVSSMLSGRLPEDIGVIRNRRWMPSEVDTIAEHASRAGVPTAAVVSNWVLRKRDPSHGDVGVQQGFGHFDDEMTAQELNRDLFERTAADTTDAAITWLERTLKNPEGDRFLLWVHYQDPHGPYTPPEAYARMFERPPSGEDPLPGGDSVSGKGQIPSYQLLPGKHEPEDYRALYDAEIRYFDDELGRLFDWLREHQLYDDSLILFTSDHGETLGERDIWFCHGTSQHREQVRVPLIVRFPGGERILNGDREEGGYWRSRKVAGHLDVFPTIAEAFGLVAGATPGRSLWTEELPEERLFYQAHWRGPRRVKHWAISDGRYRVFGIEDDLDSFRLYDVLEDPLETTDLSASQPDRVKSMVDRYATWRRSQELERHEGRDIRDGEQELRALNALGYTGGDE